MYFSFFGIFLKYTQMIQIQNISSKHWLTVFMNGEVWMMSLHVLLPPDCRLLKDILVASLVIVL